MLKINRSGWSTLWLGIFIFAVYSADAGAFAVSSPFGWRVHPIRHQREFHTGVDIAAQYGTAIPALFDGEVVWAAPRGGYGNVVILRHFSATYTLYGHCGSIYVTLRQTVKAGDTIAMVGNSGISTGPHLHLEYWVHNQYVDPMLIWKQAQKTNSNC